MATNQISTSNKISDGLALFLVALFAFPILGQAVPVINALSGDLSTYVLLLVIPLSLVSSFWGLRWNNFNTTQKVLLIYCLYYIALFTIKFAIYGVGPARVGLQIYRERTLGPWLALALFTVFAAIRGPAQRSLFLKRFAQGIALVFAMQLLLSLEETLTGNVFERTQDELAESYQQRDMFADLTSGGISRFGLHYALNGLVHQFDLYGIQLAFYNLLFLTQLTRRIRWPYVFLCVCALGAALLNTTKTGIIIIAISDLTFLAMKEGRFHMLRITGVIIGIVTLLLLYSSEMSQAILYSGAGKITINLRFDLWDSLWAWYGNNVLKEPWNLPFGFSFQDLVGATSTVIDSWNYSLQNEFILQLFNLGLVGLALFVLTFFIMPFVMYKKVPRQERGVYWLLPASLLSACITMDIQTTYYVFPLIAFIVLYLGNAQREKHQPSRPGQKALARATAARLGRQNAARPLLHGK